MMGLPRSIIHNWITLGTVMNLLRSGRPTKISPRAECKIIKETKKPDIMAKERRPLALAKVKVHESTITRTLGRLAYVQVFETENQQKRQT